MEKIYNYSLEYDFLEQTKTKKATEDTVIAETKTRVVVLEGKFKHSEYLRIFNKDKENRSDIYSDLGKVDTSKFQVGDFIDKVHSRIHLTEKPKSEKVIFNRLTKALNSFIQKEYGKYGIENLDFSDIETVREV